MHLGKDKLATLLAVFLIFAASASGQIQKSYKFQLDGRNVQTNEIIAGDQSIIINYALPELNISSQTNPSGTFYRLSVPGHVSSSDPGKPELPIFCRLITIPEGASVKIRITEVRSTRINPAGKKFEGILFPAQESEIKTFQKQQREFRIDKEVYASPGFISTDTIRIEPLGTARNNKLANLYISPVRYNPHSNILQVITSMKIEIIFSNNLISKSRPTERALFNETLDKGIINFNPQQVVPGYSEQPVKMIIITDTAFKKQLQPFFKWKTRKGFKLRILYKGISFEGNDYSTLKDTLTKIYRASSTTDPPPEYLLIIGDVNRVPYFGAGGAGNVTDMYYGEFDGDGDYIPEMFIGRLPVSDTTEVKTAVNKIMQYEQFQFAGANKFYTKAIASAGFDEDYSSYMNGQLKYAYSNYLTKTNGIDEFHFNYPDSYSSKDSILKLIKTGVSFINYTGHGEALGWLHVNIKSPDILSFDNKNMYPFVISNACRTAQYSLPNSFGSRMMLTPDKGAIGFIGCSNDSYWDEDYYWAVGPGIISGNPTYETTGLGAYDRMFHSHGESPSDWYFTMGQINYAGNMSVSASTSSRKKYYWETYNLIGDPSVVPILGTPGTFNVALPDTLPNGIKSMTLNIDPFAYVAVSHFDTLWDASFASNSGVVNLKMAGLSNDSCLVVITGQNKVPVMKTIYFSNINKEFINLSGSSIIDSTGNNNGLADFGESVRLKLNLSNLGLTDAHNLYAKITSSSEFITITSDSVSIGTLTARTDTIVSESLTARIVPDVPDMSVATINLMLKDENIEKHFKIDMCIHAPELQILNCFLNDDSIGNGDNIPDPGESLRLIFKVSNKGSSDIAGQLSVSSPESDISIIMPSVKSGTLKFGQTTDIPVLVKLSEGVPSGKLISVHADLNCEPYIADKEFSFRIGKIRESFEASSFKVFPWINLSSIPWTITPLESFDGAYAAKSGNIDNGGATSLIIRTKYNTDDSVKFYYKVSSEPNYDFLTFKLNGNEIFKKSGEDEWTRASIPVSAGVNTMEWTYKKDNSVTEGSDCAWIDMIDFAQVSTVSYIQRDLQLARIVIPSKNEQYGLETITAKVLNLGKDTLNGFNLAYQVNNDDTPVKQFFENKVFPFGDSVTVSFKTKSDMSKYGIYKITAYAFNNNDDDINNDTLTANIDNSTVYEKIGVYPNPFSDKMTIIVNSKIDDRLHISLANISGVVLYNSEKDILAGNNSFTINNFRLVPALYYLKIRGTTFDKTIPVIKIGK